MVPPMLIPFILLLLVMAHEHPHAFFGIMIIVAIRFAWMYVAIRFLGIRYPHKY